jgi:hypothetical protein
MKVKVLIATIAAALGAAATAQGTSQADIRYQGVWCKTHASSHGVLCVPTTGRGYGVGITKQFVMVYNLNTGKAVKIYLHAAAGG